MDWTIFFLIAMMGAGWFFTFTFGFNVGIRFERFRRDKEVDAYVIPEENLSDGAYWRSIILREAVPDTTRRKPDFRRDEERNYRSYRTMESGRPRG